MYLFYLYTHVQDSTAAQLDWNCIKQKLDRQTDTREEMRTGGPPSVKKNEEWSISGEKLIHELGSGMIKEAKRRARPLERFN